MKKVLYAILVIMFIININGFVYAQNDYITRNADVCTYVSNGQKYEYVYHETDLSYNGVLLCDKVLNLEFAQNYIIYITQNFDVFKLRLGSFKPTYVGSNYKYSIYDDNLRVVRVRCGENEKIIDDSDVNVQIDGEYVYFDQSPIIINGRTLIPLRAVFEMLGASVDWNQFEQSVTAKKQDITVRLTVGSDELYVNDKLHLLDVPAQIISNRTLVPVRAIAESFDCDVDWLEETNTVYILRKGAIPKNRI